MTSVQNLRDNINSVLGNEGYKDLPTKMSFKKAYNQFKVISYAGKFTGKKKSSKVLARRYFRQKLKVGLGRVGDSE